MRIRKPTTRMPTATTGQRRLGYGSGTVVVDIVRQPSSGRRFRWVERRHGLLQRGHGDQLEVPVSTARTRGSVRGHQEMSASTLCAAPTLSAIPPIGPWCPRVDRTRPGDVRPRVRSPGVRRRRARAPTSGRRGAADLGALDVISNGTARRARCRSAARRCRDSSAGDVDVVHLTVRVDPEVDGIVDRDGVDEAETPLVANPRARRRSGRSVAGNSRSSAGQSGPTASTRARARAPSDSREQREDDHRRVDLALIHLGDRSPGLFLGGQARR